MQITGGLIYQIVSGEFILGIRLRCDLFGKNNRPDKFSFIAINNRTVLAVRWTVKYFYAPKSSIFRKSGGEEGENGNSKALYFTSKRKSIITFLLNNICWELTL